MNKKLIAAIGILNFLSSSISAAPKKQTVHHKNTSNRKVSPKSSKPKNNASEENKASITPKNPDVLSAEAVSAGVFDFEKIHDYKIDYGQHKGKVAPIYGLRIRITQDNAQRLKEMIALSNEEAEKIRVLPKTERHEKVGDFYKNLYQRMDTDPELVDAIYDQTNNDHRFISQSKHLYDPECYERSSEDGFLSGFYIPGEDLNKDPIILVHGGPNGSAIGMLTVGADLSKTTGRSVLAYTQRGCKGSGVSFDPGKDSFQQSAQDLDKVIDTTLALSGKKQVVVQEK